MEESQGNSKDEVSLSEDELDKIISDAELSEVSMDEKEQPEPTEAPSESSEASESTSPSPAQTAEMGEVGAEPEELEAIDEELKAIDDQPSDGGMADIDIDALGSEVEEADIDSMLEEEMGSAAEPEPTEATSEQLEQSEMPTAPADEDIGLSSNEMDGILEDVDESKVLDLKDEDEDEDENEDEALSESPERQIEREAEVEPTKVVAEPEPTEEEEPEPEKPHESLPEASLEVESGAAEASPTEVGEEVLDITKPELASLFGYLDEVLGYLPDEKIKAFAHSEYYDKYISVINKLGL